MEGSYSHHDGHPAAPGMMGYGGHGDYQSPEEGKKGRYFDLKIGMYEGDPYGDEIEGGEDKNDGLNALVSLVRQIYNDLEFTIRSWLQ